jgi:hypothetical protein
MKIPNWNPSKEHFKSTVLNLYPVIHLPFWVMDFGNYGKRIRIEKWNRIIPL